MIYLGCPVGRESAPGGGGGDSGEMSYAAVERSIQPLARRRGGGWRPRPLLHDRSSHGSSCLFLPLPSEPAVPLVGQSSPAGRRASESYPPGRPQRRAVERRPPLVAAAPTPCLGCASSPPVRTPPHRWSVASRRGHSAAASLGLSPPPRRRAAADPPPGRPWRRAVGRRPPLAAAAPTPCRGRASSPPVRTPPHRWSVASRRGHSAAASPGLSPSPRRRAATGHPPSRSRQRAIGHRPPPLGTFATVPTGMPPLHAPHVAPRQGAVGTCLPLGPLACLGVNVRIMGPVVAIYCCYQCRGPNMVFWRVY